MKGTSNSHPIFTASHLFENNEKNRTKETLSIFHSHESVIRSVDGEKKYRARVGDGWRTSKMRLLEFLRLWGLSPPSFLSCYLRYLKRKDEEWETIDV